MTSSIPPPSPNPSTVRHSLASPVRPYPIQKPGKSPMVTSQYPQPVASFNRIIEDKFPLPFPAIKLFQRRASWPVQVT
ncbi:hypothetical protein O181_015018 [Austropuccinia psidii MF-1]|uniref:Uncharacterized protein n=1 Tax=Austropuccinia psidii MF-1 TaxID=1389203 RepID=A0A9Q3C2C3_9BASI|nr:hypothetical protein [Austropuccinia psidii MF-1]